MMEGGYYQQKRLSPTGVTVVVLLHGAALFALMTAKGETFTVIRDKIPTIIDFKEPPPPPENPLPPPPKAHPQQPTVFDHPKPPIELRLPDAPVAPRDPIPIPLPPLPPGPELVLNKPTLPTPPVHEPVRIDSRIDNSSALQPPYPPSAQREGVEGMVRVRVAIGTDGRVKAVEKLGDGRDDFFAATERQALRYWRFKPATIDGKPIASSKEMTVRFRLDDLG